MSTLLRGSRRRRFSVYRTEAVSDAKGPVGSVGEILVKLMQAEAGNPERVAVMEGSLSEFDLMTVLQVISIGRQFTGVELLDPAGTPMGQIQLKAGRVVSATSGHLSGIDAIRRLLKSPRDCRFVVHRTTEEVGEEHLGSLAQIMMKIADVDAGWESAESNTQARKAPSMPPRSVPPPVLRSDPPVAVPSARAPVVALAPAEPTQVVVEMPAAVSGAVARPPIVHARYDALRRSPSSGFVEKHTSPFGIHLVPATPGEAPVICVTSPKGGAGKTTVALNLGVAFARQGSRVLLVDTDYNGVLMAIQAKARSPSGAYSVVSGQASLADAVLKTRLPGLQILPWGDATGEPAAPPPNAWSDLFRSARAEAPTSSSSTRPQGLLGRAQTRAPPPPTRSSSSKPSPPGSALWRATCSASPLWAPRPRSSSASSSTCSTTARAYRSKCCATCAAVPPRHRSSTCLLREFSCVVEAVARGLPVCRGERANTATIGWVFEIAREQHLSSASA